MPTGYTAPIADGITFKEYAMVCARAFGATITMRDEPHNAEIPESFEASNYHNESIKKDAIELKELLTMDHDAAEAKAKEAHQKYIKYHSEAIAKDESLAAKYKAMLKEVEAYESPSPDHDDFKKFMADQITGSIKFDCSPDYHRKALESAKPMSGAEWIIAEKERLEKSTEYHKKQLQKELELTNSRNAWLKKLRASLS